MEVIYFFLVFFIIIALLLAWMIVSGGKRVIREKLHHIGATHIKIKLGAAYSGYREGWTTFRVEFRDVEGNLHRADWRILFGNIEVLRDHIIRPAQENRDGLGESNEHAMKSEGDTAKTGNADDREAC